jgi:hypothetical protein
MPSFQECVQEAWNKEFLEHHNPLSVLDIKLSRAAKALKAWSKNLVSQRKLALEICREVIE